MPDIAGLDSLKAKELEALLQSVGAPKSGNVQAKKARIIKWVRTMSLPHALLATDGLH